MSKPTTTTTSTDPVYIDRSKFAGLSEAAAMFNDFDILNAKRDPAYGYEHVFIFQIQFRKSLKYGLCIYDTNSKDFIEEPASYLDYDVTEEAMYNRFGFKHESQPRKTRKA